MPAPDPSRAYPVELILSPRGEERPASRFDLTLRDLTRQGAFRPGVVDLGFRESDPPLVDDLSVARFLRQLDRDAGAGAEEGLAFGRLLLGRLLADGAVAAFWREMSARRTAAGKPLHLQIVLPRGLGDASDAGNAGDIGEEVPDVSEIPFELLADEHGFLFRRVGSVLVRTLAGMDAMDARLEAGERAALVWANVASDTGSFLPTELFTAHEALVADLGPALGLTPVPPCGQATLESLTACLEEHAPVALVSLVAHGSLGGGQLWLHKIGHPDYPHDPGEPVSARDLAIRMRKAGAKAVLLWSCHSGRQNRVFGSVAEALLDPEQGGLAAVVASHAAFRGSATTVLARALLKALGGIAQGDLERAVGEARTALSEDYLQWAAPVYYARPFQGRSVTLAQAVAANLSEPMEEERERIVLLEGAQTLTPYFQGRSDELSRCLAHLRISRLVTVLGLPGSGKTELALAVAGAALGDGSLRLDRGLWTSLAGVRSSENLAGRLALAFGLEKLDSDEQLARAIGERRVLLVLDNAEDLIVPDRLRFQSLLGTLFRLCAGLQVLLSSRRALGDVAGTVETEFSIGRLQPPSDREVFLAAAGARLPEEERASPDLDPLVASLEGHALSLVLVAGQVGRGMNFGSLRRRLDQKGIEALTADELWGEDLTRTPDGELRTKRLLSSLNLSFQPLRQANPGAAELFACLGLLPSGLPGVLLSAVGTEGEERAAALLRVNLAEVQGRDRRLFLPAPVRLYARRQFGMLPGERRLALLAELLKALGVWLNGAYEGAKKEQIVRSVGIALQEEPNLAALLATAAEITSENLPEALAEGLAAAIEPWGHLMYLGDRSSAALSLTMQARELLRHYTASKPLADLAGLLGRLYLQTSRLREAEAEYQSALPIYRGIEDRLGEANTRKALGDLYVRTSRLREAEAEYQSALPIYRGIEARLGEANTRKALGDLYVRTDRLREAEAEYQSALPIYRGIEDRLGEANTRQALGDLYVRTSRLREAEAEYQSALPIYRGIEDRLGEANTRQALGDLYVRTSRLREAEAEYQSALPIYRGIEDRLGEANTRQALGDLYVRTDRLREAEAEYQSALPIYRGIEARLGEANTRQGLAQLALAREDPASAYSHLLAVLPLYREIEDCLGEAGTLGYLSRAAIAAGRHDRGAVLAALCWELLAELEDRYGMWLALDDLCKCFQALKDNEGTVSAFALAWNLACSIGEPSAAQRAEVLCKIFPDFDPEAEPDPEWLAELEEMLRAAVARQEEALRAAGDDPFSPLPEETGEP